MTIKQFFFKVRHRLIRIKNTPICFKKLNANSPLNLETYDGGNEGLHPSCLYFKEGWNGYKFWFVFTPYKSMNDAIENPCVYVSQDGYHFTPPYQHINPLDDIMLPKEQEYNSDPELVYNSDLNRIECWWRRVQRDKYPTDDGKNREIIYRRFTYDGRTWSEKEVMLDLKNPFDETRLCISPALIFENGIYRMWCSSAEDFEGKYRTINYYEMIDGGMMELKSKHHLKKGTISHLDVIHENSKYWLIGNEACIDGNPLKLYSFISPISDEYKYEGVVLTRGRRGQWDDRVTYRPSVVKVDNFLYLYYSAYGSNPKTSNHVGLIRFKDWNDMLKCFVKDKYRIFNK